MAREVIVIIFVIIALILSVVSIWITLSQKNYQGNLEEKQTEAILKSHGVSICVDNKIVDYVNCKSNNVSNNICETILNSSRISCYS